MPTSFLVSHSGKQHAYRHALAMQRLGLLCRFVTSSYYAPRRWPDRVLARYKPIDRVLRRRRLDGLDDLAIRQPVFELPEVVCRALVGNGRLTAGLVRRRDVSFDGWVARRIEAARWLADAFWGFQGSCLHSLAAARRRGWTAVVELATGHAPAAERILGRERERYPEWADSISNAGFPPAYRRRLEREPHEADACVVASTFTRQTLHEAGVPDAKIFTLPLGADLRKFSFARRPTGGPLRVLFVGGVGQRKGIKYLLDAYRRLGASGAKLVIVGPIVGSGRAFREHAHDAEYVGRADADEVVRQMHRCHVLALPSLFEGFGLVIVEAMATGMPVIASTHSAAPDVIRDGVDGYVLAPDDVDGLAARLDAFAANRRAVDEMGAAAAVRAAEFSWDRHMQRLADVCRAIGARHDAVAFA